MYFVLFCLFMDVYYIYFCFDFYSDMYNALAICTYVRHANKAIWIELNWERERERERDTFFDATPMDAK